jgi:hypothetical protein
MKILASLLSLTLATSAFADFKVATSFPETVTAFPDARIDLFSGIFQTIPTVVLDPNAEIPKDATSDQIEVRQIDMIVAEVRAAYPDALAQNNTQSLCGKVLEIKDILEFSQTEKRDSYQHFSDVYRNRRNLAFEMSQLLGCNLPVQIRSGIVRYIDNKLEAFCLNVQSPYDGQVNNVWGCGNSVHQQWDIIRNNDGTYAIRNRYFGNCLNLAGSVNGNGTDTWTCGESLDQKWKLNPTLIPNNQGGRQVFENGRNLYQLESVRAPGKCVFLSVDARNGTRTYIEDCGSADSSKLGYWEVGLNMVSTVQR